MKIHDAFYSIIQIVNLTFKIHANLYLVKEICLKCFFTNILNRKILVGSIQSVLKQMDAIIFFALLVKNISFQDRVLEQDVEAGLIVSGLSLGRFIVSGVSLSRFIVSVLSLGRFIVSVLSLGRFIVYGLSLGRFIFSGVSLGRFIVYGLSLGRFIVSILSLGSFIVSGVSLVRFMVSVLGLGRFIVFGFNSVYVYCLQT